MSKADKMFEELGYILHKENFDFSIFIKNGRKMINFEVSSIFNKSLKGVELHGDGNIIGLDLNELKAIHEKLKELGWIE